MAVRRPWPLSWPLSRVFPLFSWHCWCSAATMACYLPFTQFQHYIPLYNFSFVPAKCLAHNTIRDSKMAQRVKATATNQKTWVWFPRSAREADPTKLSSDLRMCALAHPLPIRRPRSHKTQHFSCGCTSMMWHSRESSLGVTEKGNYCLAMVGNVCMQPARGNLYSGWEYPLCWSGH